MPPPPPPPSPSVSWKQAFGIILAGAGLIAAIHLVPGQSTLSHMDFIPGGQDAIEFCDPQKPKLIAVATKSQSVTIALAPSSRLFAGASQATAVRLSLRTASGKPVGVKNLIPSPTGALRIFILSEDLTDFQTSLPVPAERAGDWSFEFLPKVSGLYRVFADMTPAATGREVYAYSDLAVENEPPPPGSGVPSGFPPPAGAPAPAEVPSAAPTARPERNPRTVRNAAFARSALQSRASPPRQSRFSTRAESEGCEFELLPAAPPAYANQPITLSLKITRPDGSAVLLVPFQGSFVHLELFDEARSGFLTLSPSASVTGVPPDPFRPAFRFTLSIPDPGRYVAWVRVAIAGKETSVPLALEVLP